MPTNHHCLSVCADSAVCVNVSVCKARDFLKCKQPQGRHEVERSCVCLRVCKLFVSGSTLIHASTGACTHVCVCGMCACLACGTRPALLSLCTSLIITGGLKVNPRCAATVPHEACFDQVELHTGSKMLFGNW